MALGWTELVLNEVWIELCFTLQGLYGSLDQREDLLDELRAAAEPLASSCDPEVSQKIEAAVEEALTAWNDTCQSLLDLCNRYQDAVRLWKQYREASEAVKAWADQQLESVAQFKPDEALRQVKVNSLFTIHLFLSPQIVLAELKCGISNSKSTGPHVSCSTRI
jgi:hypothetical protein